MVNATRGLQSSHEIRIRPVISRIRRKNSKRAQAYTQRQRRSTRQRSWRLQCRIPQPNTRESNGTRSNAQSQISRTTGKLSTKLSRDTPSVRTRGKLWTERQPANIQLRRRTTTGASRTNSQCSTSTIWRELPEPRGSDTRKLRVSSKSGRTCRTSQQRTEFGAVIRKTTK